MAVLYKPLGKKCIYSSVVLKHIWASMILGFIYQVIVFIF